MQTPSLVHQILTEEPVAIEKEEGNDDEDFEEEGRSAQSRSGRWSRSVLPFFVEQEENDDHDSGVNDNFAGDEREEESMVDGKEWSATV